MMAPKDHVNIATTPYEEVHMGMYSRAIGMAPFERYHGTSDHWLAIEIPSVGSFNASHLLFHPKPFYQIL